MNNKPNLIFPIVGMHYRPPANTIVRNLPLNTPLTLIAEPWNEHDTNAIAVYVAREELIKTPTLNALADRGVMVFELDAAIQLGYIPAVDAARLQFDRTKHILGVFVLTSENKPAVRMTKFEEN